jgi:hypothetical protein
MMKKLLVGLLTLSNLAFGDGRIRDADVSVSAAINPTKIAAGNWAGNAATATQLASSPTQCPGGQYASGIDTFGNLTCSSVTSGINQLTSDVTAGPGSGSQAATVALVGGSSAANVHAAELAANAATDLNTASKIVKRDASGNFVAGTITAALAGNALTATRLAATPTKCSAGNYPLGVDDQGNAQNCTAAASVTPANLSVGSGLTISAGTGTGAVLQALTVGIAAGFYLPSTTDQTNWNAKLGASAIGVSVQAWDADLDALAALSGTNTIYYRSGANTWSAVTISTGLSFSGGVLSATAGGTGNLNAKFTLDGAVVPYTSINGPHYQVGTLSLTAVYISALNSGSSGSTTIQVNQYRSGSLQGSATASLSASSSAPAGSNAALSGTLSLAAGDIITVDVNSAATGASDLSVEY